MRSALRFFRRAPASAVLALLSLLTGCDADHASAETRFTLPAQATAAAPVLRDANEVPHVGVRRVELYDRSVEPARYLAYRERIASDGSGAFALTPTEAITAVAPDWVSFSLQQRSRARFLMRYRDFAVRDAELFRRNWVLEDLERSEVVAGRAVSVLVARRADGSHAYELSVDDETDLILGARELGPEGELLSLVEYETYEPRTEFGDVVFHRSSLIETPLDIDGDIDGDIGRPVIDLQQGFEAELLQPRLLPAGFEFNEASTLVDEDGQSWAKMTYTDGVDTLFFAHSLPENAVPHRLPQGDELVVSSMGSVTSASGRIGAHRIVVLGKVDARALLDLVESALR